MNICIVLDVSTFISEISSPVCDSTSAVIVQLPNGKKRAYPFDVLGSVGQLKNLVEGSEVELAGKITF